MYNSETTYVYSNFGIFRCTKLFKEDETWWTKEPMPVKAVTANLIPFSKLVGTEVIHKKYNIPGKILFNCTTDNYEKKPWFSKERQFRKFVFVKWYTEGMDIIPSWININQLTFK